MITINIDNADLTEHHRFCRYRLNFTTGTIIQVNESGRVLKPEVYDWLVEHSGEEVVVFRLLDRMFYHERDKTPEGYELVNKAEYKHRTELMKKYNPIVDRRDTWALPNRNQILFSSAEKATLFKLTWL